MDEFRVSFTSPYARDAQHGQAEGGKRRKRNPSGDGSLDGDKIVFSGEETELAGEDIVDTYTPGERTEG